MNYKIVNGSVSYGAEKILEEINFEIKEKDKRKTWNAGSDRLDKRRKNGII